MKYEILQINSQLENAHCIMFARYDFIKEHFPDVETLLKLYKHVYEGEIEARESKIAVLEELFRIFNIEHPEDFRGHSLSVSDIVYFPEDEEYWICDSFGWVNLE